MSLISVTDAASRLRLHPETIEDWGRRGLLDVDSDQMVDEEKLGDLVESLGWLQLSADAWDEGEGQ